MRFYAVIIKKKKYIFKVTYSSSLYLICDLNLCTSVDIYAYLNDGTSQKA
jgi:hypothetical protein